MMNVNKISPHQQLQLDQLRFEQQLLFPNQSRQDPVGFNDFFDQMHRAPQQLQNNGVHSGQLQHVEEERRKGEIKNQIIRYRKENGDPQIVQSSLSNERTQFPPKTMDKSNTPKSNTDSPRNTSNESTKKKAQPVNDYLYDTKRAHPIIEYKPTKEETETATITPSFVLEVTWPRIIQFYHPASPRCQSFQSTYVSLARGIKRRSSRLPVEFHAVNCGVYREVCELGFDVKSVPTLLGLRSGRIEGAEVVLPGISYDDASKKSKEEISQDVELKVEFIADALGFTLDVVGKSTGGAFPKAAGKDVDHGSAGSFEDDGDLVHKESSVNRKEVEGDADDNASLQIFVSSSEHVFHDATSSLMITLTSSLYSPFPHGSALPPDTSAALREFIDLIRWAYPPETKVHNLAEDLKVDFFGVSTSEEGMLKVLGRHMNLAEGVTWSPRCSGGDSESGSGGEKVKGGYSCGIWSLLHILSVGVAERHTSVVGDIDRVSVQHAGKVMRTFVEKFFIGCDSCRKLWTELYDELCCGLYNTDHTLAYGKNGAAVTKSEDGEGEGVKSGDSDWRNLSIWIWELHNEITVRGVHRAGRGYSNRFSRVAPSSSLWPSREDCPKCWELPSNGDGQVANMDSFDCNALYHHLKNTYWVSGVQNNRLIVLDRWTKSKRAISLKRLRDRIASRWSFSSLFLNALFVWFVLYISLLLLTQLRQKVCLSTIRGSNRKKKVQMDDQSDLDDMSASTYDDSHGYPRNSNKNSPYKTTAESRSRRSNNTPKHLPSDHGGSSLMSSRYPNGVNGRRMAQGRRYRSGSGFKSSSSRQHWYQV